MADTVTQEQIDFPFGLMAPNWWQCLCAIHPASWSPCHTSSVRCIIACQHL